MTYCVNKGRLILNMEPIHQRVFPYFPQYRVDKMTPGACIDYTKIPNVVGDQQRAWMIDKCLMAFTESGGIPGVEFGSAGVQMPGALSTDIIGSGETPSYGGVVSGVHLKLDASKKLPFATGSFSFVMASHTIEHLECTMVPVSAPDEEKIRTACRGLEIIPILREWIRILRPGGYLCLIFPDDGAARAGGSSTFYHDKTHAHAWDAHAFYQNIMTPLFDVIELIEYNSFGNRFSVSVLGRRI